MKDNSPSLAEEVQAAIRAEELDESDAQLEESDAEEEDDAKEKGKEKEEKEKGVEEEEPKAATLGARLPPALVADDWNLRYKSLSLVK